MSANPRRANRTDGEKVLAALSVLILASAMEWACGVLAMDSFARVIVVLFAVKWMLILVFDLPTPPRNTKRERPLR